jgi:hypothetical protein
MSDDKVVPIERASVIRARALSRDDEAGRFIELTRADVGERTFIAEVGRQRGADVWRIRVLGSDDVADFFDESAHREAFAALVAQDVATVEEWFEAQQK